MCVWLCVCGTPAAAGCAGELLHGGGAGVQPAGRQHQGQRPGQDRQGVQQQPPHQPLPGLHHVSHYSHNIHKKYIFLELMLQAYVTKSISNNVWYWWNCEIIYLLSFFICFWNLIATRHVLYVLLTFSQGGWSWPELCWSQCGGSVWPHLEPSQWLASYWSVRCPPLPPPTPRSNELTSKAITMLLFQITDIALQLV